MRIIHISDTHGEHHNVSLPEPQDDDVLIHSGDLGNVGDESELIDFSEWWHKLPYNMKIYIPGNHCRQGRIELEDALQSPTSQVLINKSFIYNGVHFYGTPYTRTYGKGWNFMGSEDELEQIFSKIPEGTNVLICHGPPYGTLDEVFVGGFAGFIRQGSEALARRIENLKESGNLRLVLFGHLHDGYGVTQRTDNIIYSNASMVDASYQIVNFPNIFEVQI